MSYIPKDAVTQAFRSNKGVLTPNQIIELDNENKFTKYGQLELIQTQTVTGTPSTLSFDSIQESTYNVHFVTWNDYAPETDNRHLTVQFKTGGTADGDSGAYGHAMARVNASTVTALVQGSDTRIYLVYSCSATANERAHGYFYIYNAGDSTKYTFVTGQTTLINKDSNMSTNFYSGTYDRANIVDGLQFQTSGGNLEHGTFSLYGIRFS